MTQTEFEVPAMSARVFVVRRGEDKLRVGRIVHTGYALASRPSAWQVDVSLQLFL